MPLIRRLVNLGQEAYQQHQESRANNAQNNTADTSQQSQYANRNDYSQQGQQPGGYHNSQQNQQQGPQQQHHRSSRNQFQRPLQDQYDDPPPAYGEWELDEAQDRVVDSKARPREIQTSPQSWSQLPEDTPLSPLDCVVLLPQRRPNSGNQGFIRAYAPVLEEKGIDDTTFIQFIETFNGLCQTTSWVHATNFATLGAHNVPPALVIPIATIIGAATDATIGAHHRRETNAALTRLNKQLFLPRNLYCLLVTYKPNASAVSITVDVASAQETLIDGGGDSETFRFRNKYAGPDGPEYELFPDPAILTFPYLDHIATTNNADEAAIRASLSDGSGLANQYVDAQRSYAMNDPNNQGSHYDDATDPNAGGRGSGRGGRGGMGMGMGMMAMRGGMGGGGGMMMPMMMMRGRGRRRRGPGLVGGLQTAGGAAMGGRGRGRGGRNQQSDDAAYADQASSMGQHGRSRSADQRGQNQQSGHGPVPGVFQMLRQNQILYLAIVDLPNHQQLMEAQQALIQMDPVHAQTFVSAIRSIEQDRGRQS